MNKRQSPALRTLLVRALMRACVVTLMVGAALVGASHMHTDMSISEDGQSQAQRPVAKGSPQAVLSRMGDKCWTGEAPADMAGIVPGHVVYSDGADGAHVGGSRMVGIALDSIFKKPVKGLTVYAFCL